jgi:hypothetical protein
VLRVDRVTEKHRRPEPGGLLDERDDGMLDERRQGRGADCSQRAEQEAVGQTVTEARVLPVFLVVVNRVVVAGHPGEEEKVCVGQRPRRALETVADLEVLEVALAHQAAQNAS